jgi:hypothetical protein
VADNGQCQFPPWLVGFYNDDEVIIEPEKIVISKSNRRDLIISHCVSLYGKDEPERILVSSASPWLLYNLPKNIENPSKKFVL